MKPIKIVGGGLAGLSLGIGLRQRGVPVEIWEAGSYPRHRVCGEFLFGRGQAALGRISSLDRLKAAGLRFATEISFFAEHRRLRACQLDPPAWCCSRFALDAFLADEFRRIGGELREKQRWRGSEDSEGLVLATGRRTQGRGHPWRWMGLKAHAQGAALGSDLEMYWLPNGYVGLCNLGQGRVNVCGLFRMRQPDAELRQRWPDYLRGAPGSLLAQRLAGAKFDAASFCAVAGFSFRPFYGAPAGACAIGDRMSMIAPLSGNGMSIALESAELAIEPLMDFCLGRQGWRLTHELLGRRQARRFRRRIWLGYGLQGALFSRMLHRFWLELCQRCPGLLRQAMAWMR